MRLIGALCSLICLVGGVHAADPPADSLHLPPDGFAPGWVKSEPVSRFTQSDLYGYIDGGAELFLEFGFDELLVQRYRKGDYELDLEVYRMQSPASALGIYYSRRGDETPIALIPARNTGSRYQLSVVSGDYFIQVNNFEGDSALLPVMALLAVDLLNEIPVADSVTVLDNLPPEHLVPGTERLIRGPYALQPIFTFGEGDILQLGGKVFGVVGNYTDSAGNIFTRIVIPYSNDKTAAAAYQHLLTHLDPYLTVMENTETGFTFQDYQKMYGRVVLDGSTLNIDIKLRQKPGPAGTAN